MSRTLQQTIDWARPFISYINPAVGTNNEPAVTNATNVKQLFMSPDVMTFSWSRSSATFQTLKGKQDYVVSIPTFGYLETASLQPSASITNVAGDGTTATITALNSFAAGPTTISGLTTTVFNGTFTILNATPTQFTFASTNVVASVADTGIAVSGQKFQIPDVRNTEPLAESSDQSRPNAIAVQYDDGDDNITFRFMGVPGQQYQCILNFQQAALPFVLPTDTWAPIPDRYAYIYNRGFLAESLEPFDPQRAQAEKQRFILSLVSIAEGLELMDKAIFISQYLNIDAETATNMLNAQQGTQAKGQK